MLYIQHISEGVNRVLVIFAQGAQAGPFLI